MYIGITYTLEDYDFGGTLFFLKNMLTFGSPIPHSYLLQAFKYSYGPSM